MSRAMVLAAAFIASRAGAETGEPQAIHSALETLTATSTNAGASSSDETEVEAEADAPRQSLELKETNYRAYVSGGVGALAGASGLALLLRGLTGSQGTGNSDDLEGADTRKRVGVGLLVGAAVALTYSAILYFSEDDRAEGATARASTAHDVIGWSTAP